MPLFKNTLPEEPKPKRKSILARIVNFTASDTDYVPDVREQSVKVAVKPVNIGKRIRAIVIVTAVFYLLLCTYVILNSQYAQFFADILKIEYLVVIKVLEYTIYGFFSLV